MRSIITEFYNRDYTMRQKIKSLAHKIGSITRYQIFDNGCFRQYNAIQQWCLFAS